MKRRVIALTFWWAVLVEKKRSRYGEKRSENPPLSEKKEEPGKLVFALRRAFLFLYIVSDTKTSECDGAIRRKREKFSEKQGVLGRSVISNVTRIRLETVLRRERYHNRFFSFPAKYSRRHAKNNDMITKVPNGTIHVPHGQYLHAAEFFPLLNGEAWKVSEELDYHRIIMELTIRQWTPTEIRSFTLWLLCDFGKYSIISLSSIRNG